MTNYYLHMPSQVQAVHIGKRDGDVWTTDLSPRDNHTSEPLYTTLPELLTFLRSRQGMPGWVVSEYGDVMSPWGMVSTIRECKTRRELETEFS